MNTTAKELSVLLAERVEARKAEVAERIEVRKLENQINFIESPLFEARELDKEDNLVLDAYLTHIEEMYAVSKRKVSKTFGYGVIPNKVLTIAKSVMYCKAEEKLELLAMTGLNETQVEDIVDAFGMTAYFSPKSLDIVEAVPMSDNITDIIAQACSDMGLVSSVNYGKFTKSNIDYQYTRASLKANEALENTLKYADKALPAFTE